MMRWIDGRKIQPNDQCRCGSGQKFKHCCRDLIERDPPTPYIAMGIYLSSSALWPRQRLIMDHVRLLVREFDGPDLLQTLGKIDAFMYGHYLAPVDEVERHLMERFLPPAWWFKTRIWLDRGLGHKLIHRLLTLATIQLTLTEAVPGGQGKKVEDQKESLGIQLLHVSSMLEKEPTGVPSATWRTEHRQLCAGLFRLLFYTDQERLGNAIGRHWALLGEGLTAAKDKYPGEWFDFHTEFERAFGISHSQMVAQTLGVLAHYQGLRERFRKGELTNPADFNLGPGYFSTLKSESMRALAHKAFDYLGLSWDEHVSQMQKRVSKDPDGLHHFFTIYSHPLISLHPGIYCPLDLTYLELAISEGAYWALFTRLLEAGRRGDAEHFRAIIGRSFEWYVAEYLREAFPATENQQRWLDWDGEIPSGTGIRSIDAIIREGETLFVIEATSSAVKPSDAASGDPDVLEAALRTFWFGRGDAKESAKLLQLSDTVRRIEDGSLTLPSFEQGTVEHVVPILVTLRAVPQKALLNHWYRLLMTAEGLDERFSQRVVFLDIGELEHLAALKLQGRSWSELFDAKRRGNFNDETMNTFLYFAKEARDRHPRLQRWMDPAFNEAMQLLFEKPFQPPTERTTA